MLFLIFWGIMVWGNDYPYPSLLPGIWRGLSNVTAARVGWLVVTGPWPSSYPVASNEGSVFCLAVEGYPLLLVSTCQMSCVLVVLKKVSSNELALVLLLEAQGTWAPPPGHAG